MNDGRDVDPVSFGRWREAHDALVHRVSVIEGEQIRSNWSAVHQRLAERLDDVESDIKAVQSIFTKRKDKQWVLVMAFLTGLVLPLAVVALIALFSAQMHLGLSSS